MPKMQISNPIREYIKTLRPHLAISMNLISNPIREYIKTPRKCHCFDTNAISNPIREYIKTHISEFIAQAIE